MFKLEMELCMEGELSENGGDLFVDGIVKRIERRLATIIIISE